MIQGHVESEYFAKFAYPLKAKSTIDVVGCGVTTLHYCLIDLITLYI